MRLSEQYPYLSSLVKGLTFYAYDAGLLHSRPPEYHFVIWKDIITHQQEQIPHILQELNATAQDPSFDWLTLALETGFLQPALLQYPDSHLTAAVVFEYFKLLTWGALYPEYAFTQTQFEYLRRSIFYLLRDIALRSDEWVDIRFIIDCLRQIDGSRWALLEQFHMEYINLQASPFKMTYSHVKVQRRTPREDWHFFNPITHLRIWPGTDRTELEATPEILFMDGQTEAGIEPGDFKWPEAYSRLVTGRFFTNR